MGAGTDTAATLGYLARALKAPTIGRVWGDLAATARGEGWSHQCREGRDLLGLGYAGLRPGPDWQMKREMLTPRATTHWGELATALA